MRRNASFGRLLAQPKYGVIVTLTFCSITVILSLYYLDELTPKVSHRKFLHTVDRDVNLFEQNIPRFDRDILKMSPLEEEDKDTDEDDNKKPKIDSVDRTDFKNSVVVWPKDHFAVKLSKRNNNNNNLNLAHTNWTMLPDAVKGSFRSPVVLNDLEIVAHNASIDQSHGHMIESNIIYRHRLQSMNYSNGSGTRLNSYHNATSSANKKYIIYLCTKSMTCCGWGDRQHGILSAYVISLVTNRIFGVDMSAPCPLSNLLHPRKLMWKINPADLEGLSTKYIYTVNDKVFRQMMGQINFDEVYPQDVVYLTTNYDYFYSLKRNPHYRKIFRQKITKPRPLVFADLWLNVFKLNKRVKRRVTAAIAKAHPTPNHKLVCAHVRFGRSPTIPWDSEIRNTMETVLPLWNFLSHYTDPSFYKIFIASDTEMVLDKARQLYPQQMVEIKGDIIHIDKTKHMVSDPCVGFEKVLADQYFLTNCDVLVLTYSVFGKSAAYMRRSNSNLFYLGNGLIQPLKLFKD
ncbi:uncharacterized protein LOC121373316 [Gigantopelta aegis]|uniref:uncharacterized protein LOC121373316 n=1 Tax=Gigantopelta aegis TaxID=1735272 RepID=UPI001B8880CA|nr:uncharacterized protein LOC121373316 [Gigantopelta aegis]